ncbi:MAG TPA: SDR family NAD(P)-dependent oxidoreductase, partial [Vicinamibacterales bacterium]
RSVSEEIRGLGRRCLAIQCDVAQASQVTKLVEDVHRELGPIGILVNNAGVGGARTLEQITEQDWDDMLATNLKGAFLVTQAVLPDMRAARWGRIIFLSSVAAQVGGAVGPHYAASKAGVLGLTHYYAARLANEGITANAIAPGPISTDMLSGLPQLTPEMMPVGRFGSVGEVAEVATMIARNGYITGQTININGGRYLG